MHDKLDTQRLEYVSNLTIDYIKWNIPLCGYRNQIEGKLYEELVWGNDADSERQYELVAGSFSFHSSRAC